MKNKTFESNLQNYCQTEFLLEMVLVRCEINKVRSAKIHNKQYIVNK